MKIKSEIRPQKVLLYGLGVTGKSVIRFLPRHGWEVYVYTDDGVKEEDLFSNQTHPERVHPVKKFDQIPWEALSFVIKAPGIRLDKPLLIEAEKRGMEVLSDLELAYRLFGGEHLIAITGSNGKTTTTSLIAHLLNQADRLATACGNIGFPVLQAFEEASEDGWLVCEASSFQLASVIDFNPFCSAIINITPDHLEWHGSFEAYAQCKYQVASHQTKDHWIFLNPRDKMSRKAEQEGIFSGKVSWIDFSSSLATELHNKEFWHLYGEHNVENALFAAAIAETCALSKEEIYRGLSTFRAIPHRIETVDEIDGIRYINDSKATNVDSTVRALESMDAPVLLIAGGYDKKVPFSDLFEAFKGRGKALILMGETKYQIKEGAENAGLADQVHLVENLSQAVDLAETLAKKGDVVLLSPASASWDMYPGYEARGEEFRQLVREIRIKNDRSRG